MVGFELILDALPIPRGGKQATRPPLQASPFMPLRRDFAFVVSRDTPRRRLSSGRCRRQGAGLRSLGVRRVRRRGLEQGMKSHRGGGADPAAQRDPYGQDIEALAGRIVEQSGEGDRRRLRQ